MEKPNSQKVEVRQSELEQNVMSEDLKGCIEEIDMNLIKGQVSVATKEINNAIKVITKENGENNLILADFCEKYGLKIWKAKNFDFAIKLYKTALTIKQKKYGENHKDVAELLGKIGKLCEEWNASFMAIDYYKDQISVLYKINGEDNLEIAQKHEALALLCSNHSFQEMELENYIAALKIKKKVLGEFSKELVDLYPKIIEICKKDDKDKNKTLVYLLEQSKLNEKLLGNDNPSLAPVYKKLSEFYFDTYGDEKSVEYFTKYFDIQKKMLGTDSPDYAHLCREFASLLIKTGNIKKSLELCHEALAVSSKLPYESTCLRIEEEYKKYAEIFINFGYREEAISYILEVLKVLEKSLKNNPQRLLDSYQEFLEFCDILDLEEKANEVIQRSLDVLEKNKDQLDKHDYKFKFQIIARHLLFFGKIDKSIELYNKIIESNKEEMEKNRVDLAEIYYEIAKLLIDIEEKYGNKDELIIKYINLGNSILEKARGENNLEMCEVWNETGKFYKDRKMSEKASEFYIKAIDIQKKHYGEKSNYMMKPLNNLILNFAQLGLSDLVKKYEPELVSIYLKCYGESNNQTKVLYDAIALDFMKQKKYDLALEYYNKSLEHIKKSYKEELDQPKNSEQPHAGIKIPSNEIKVSGLIGKKDDGEEIVNPPIMKSNPSEIDPAKREKFLDCLKNIGACYVNAGEVDKAKSLFEKWFDLQAKWNEVKNGRFEFSKLSIIADIFSDGGQDQIAIDFLNRALEMVSKKNGDGEIQDILSQIYMELGWKYNAMKQIDKAFENQLKALNIAAIYYTKIKNFEKLSELYITLADNCKEWGKIKESIEFLNEALKYYKQYNKDDLDAIKKIYLRLAEVYANNGQLDKEVECFNNIIEIREKSGADPRIMAYQYMNIAKLCATIGQSEKAIEYNSKAISIKNLDRNLTDSSVAQAQLEIAKEMLKLKQYEKAMEHLNKCIPLFAHYTAAHKKKTEEAYEKLIEIYQKLGNAEKVKEYQRTLANIKIPERKKINI